MSDPDAVEDQGSKNRRLLNTEKIIFQAESTKPVGIQLLFLATIVAWLQNRSGAPFDGMIYNGCL